MIYKCSICGKEYSRAYDCKRHEQKCERRGITRIDLWWPYEVTKCSCRADVDVVVVLNRPFSDARLNKAWVYVQGSYDEDMVVHKLAEALIEAKVEELKYTESALKSYVKSKAEITNVIQGLSAIAKTFSDNNK